PVCFRGESIRASGASVTLLAFWAFRASVAGITFRACVALRAGCITVILDVGLHMVQTVSCDGCAAFWPVSPCLFRVRHVMLTPSREESRIRVSVNPGKG